MKLNNLSSVFIALMILYFAVLFFKSVFLINHSIMLGISSFVVLLNYSFNKSKVPSILLLFFCIVILFNNMNENTNYTVNNSLLLILTLVTSIFTVENVIIKIKKEQFVLFIEFIVLSLFLIFLISIPTLYSIPKILRNINSQEKFISMGYLWLIDYGTIHGLPFIIPPIFLLIKSSTSWKKFLFISFLITILVISIVGDATTSLILVVLSISLSFIIKENDTRKQVGLKLISVLFLVLLLYQLEILLHLLNIISYKLAHFSIFEKINEITSYLYYNTNTFGDLEARENRYLISWNSFRGNIIFGTNSINGNGNHSQFLDTFASLGIIGGLPFILIFIIYFIRIKKYLSHSLNHYYISVFTVFAMFFLKNAFSFNIYLYAFIIMPALFIYFEIIKDSN